jgi:hypothetical protein
MAAISSNRWRRACARGHALAVGEIHVRACVDEQANDLGVAPVAAAAPFSSSERTRSASPARRRDQLRIPRRRTVIASTAAGTQAQQEKHRGEHDRRHGPTSTSSECGAERRPDNRSGRYNG